MYGLNRGRPHGQSADALVPILGRAAGGDNVNQSIYDLVTATLAEVGMPTPAAVIQTMLMQDGYFVGWKFRYDGGQAIFQAGGNAVEFYADDGTVLKTVAADAARGEAA